MFVGLGVGLWCSFRPAGRRCWPRSSPWCEGAVLGVISRFYAGQGTHVVTLAVVGHRRRGGRACGPSTAPDSSGWGTRFFRITLVAGVGMIAVMLTAILTGWGLSGIGGFLIFGVLYLILAVMNLFVDFSFVDRAEAAGIDADAEWFSAFMLLQSSMMVYLALLRIFGGRS